MTKVKLKYGNGYMKIEMEGHTDTKVCAGLSAIIQTAALGLERIAKDHPQHVKLEVEVNETNRTV